MHRLLSRQIRRHYLAAGLPEEMTPLIEAIDQAYSDFENERALLERSLELVSDELNQRNLELSNRLGQLEDTYRQLGDSLAVLDGIFNATGEAILAFDHKNRLVRFNKMAQDILGVDKLGAAYGTNRILWSFCKLLATVEEFIDELRRIESDPQVMIFGLAQMKDRRLFEYHSSPQFAGGKLAGRVWCFRNVTQIKENEALVKYQAFHDSLTQLPNRVLLHDRLSHAIQLAFRQRELLAVLFIDLDDFKKVNDSVGHQVGDELLKEVSQRIRQCLREHDTLARFGGDEFVVLLENIRSHRVATHTCQRILDQLKAPFELSHKLFHISCSIGVSIYPRDDTEAQELIRKADLAMYHAKEKGRSQFEYFDSPLERIAQYQLEMENRLREAFENDRLCVFYQPQVALKQKGELRMEALLRWFPNKDETISPADFIPVAERAGLIGIIGHWVLEQVCRQIQRWRQQGFPDVRVSVNLSAQQFTSENLLSDFIQIMRRYQVSGEQLEVEITESMLLDDLEKVSGVLQQLRRLDIAVSIDDFGTGYSSLKYLQKLPIDSVKIDRSFISELARNPGNLSIVDAIISLGHSLNLEVIAEGVEDQSVVELLQQKGCDYIQGFYFYKPMPASDVERILLGPMQP